MLGKKRITIYVVMLVLVIVLCACGKSKIQASIDLSYGDTYKIEHEQLKGRDLTWSSSDEHIVTVDKFVVTAIAPGDATVFAKENDAIVAEYSVNVTVVLPTNIVLSTNTYEITEGEETTISYTLFPSNANDYGLEWKSADDTVATVNESGCIKAVAPGQTTISVSNTEGLFATCSVTVKKALPNFVTLYSKWSNEKWFSVSDDGTWMRFDSNPNDDDDEDFYKFYDSFLAVNEHLQTVLEELGYNSAVYVKMNETTWSMGKQTASTDTTTVSWTYHPDKGLEVLFEVNN